MKYPNSAIYTSEDTPAYVEKQPSHYGHLLKYSKIAYEETRSRRRQLVLGG